MFHTEEEMSKRFEQYLKSNFGNTYFKEYSGLFGIPDFVLYSTQMDDDISVISFELKLTDWRRAAKQAFRYKSFSDVVYVVLPDCSIKAAVCNIEIFERYGIGLAKFNRDKQFEVIYKPKSRKPYSKALREKLVKSICQSRRKSKGIAVLI